MWVCVGGEAAWSSVPHSGVLAPSQLASHPDPEALAVQRSMVLGWGDLCAPVIEPPGKAQLEVALGSRGAAFCLGSPSTGLPHSCSLGLRALFPEPCLTGRAVEAWW